MSLVFIYLAARFNSYLADISVTRNQLGLPEVSANNETLRTILQILFAVIALVAVIYIMITGLKLVVQQGDPQGISKARQGIIYAAVGLAIALSAEIIVTFVMGQL